MPRPPARGPGHLVVVVATVPAAHLARSSRRWAGPSGVQGLSGRGVRVHPVCMTLASDDKVLILLRHAKAEQVLGKPDHDRELTHRGERDARAAGRWLHDHEIGAELVLCSDSTRTRHTWAAAVEGGACGETVEFTPALYSGSAQAVLHAVREQGGEAQVVLVVGHNPTMASLASGLAEGDGSSQAHECLADGFPTSSLAVLRFAGNWQDLDFGTAVLERCHTARG
jgi:phosphohistidine phosphatase